MASHRAVGQPPPHKRQRTANGAQATNQHQAQQPPPRQEFHRLLEISQINILSRDVQNWIFEQCALSDHIEIEAKLGRLLTFQEPDGAGLGLTSDEVEEQKNEIRVHDKVGLKSLCWVDLHKTGGHFESTVSEQVFRHLNGIFNAWYANCNSPVERRLPALQRIEFPKLLYKRSRTVDKIYAGSSVEKAASVRVTIDMADPSRIAEVIEKKKKSSMNICYPKSKWDLRISASIENVVPKPQGQIVSSLRCKDRISYQYDHFSIDITSTYTYSEGLTPQFIAEIMRRFENKQELPMDRAFGTIRSYEVELEIKDHEYLSQIRKLAADKREFYKLQQLSYFFTQASIQLAELASNLRFKPSVCRLPERK